MEEMLARTKVAGNSFVSTTFREFRECAKRLYGFHFDVILGACGIRKLIKNSTIRHTPASRRKWQSRAWPSLQGVQEEACSD
jgi:hypothetical protein